METNKRCSNCQYYRRMHQRSGQCLEKGFIFSNTKDDKNEIKFMKVLAYYYCSDYKEKK